MKELYRFRQFLTEGVIKENISSHKEEAKRFLEKFVDDNEDKFEFIPDLETGYIDANDNSYNVDELASIFLDIGQDIPRGTHNQKYKGEGGTYVVVSEGVIKEDMSIEDVYNDAQKQVKDIYDIDVPMNVVKQWADNYQFPYSREVDPEDEDQYILVYDFGTEERGDFMEWLKDNNLKENDKNDYANSEEDYTDSMVIEKIKDIIKYHELDPSDVLEEIGQEFGVSFEFGRG